MKHSESITKIAPALLKAQKLIGSVAKDNQAKIPTKTGGQYTYNYADLPSVIDACKQHLNDNEIIVLQPITEDGYVTTTLIHTSGEWISDGGVKIINARENDPQAQGSAITYARRYGLQSMIFIPAEDDDGNKATGKKEVVKTVNSYNPTATTLRNTLSTYTNGEPLATAKQKGYILAMARDLYTTDQLKDLSSRMGILTVTKAGEVIKDFEAKIAILKSEKTQEATFVKNEEKTQPSGTGEVTEGNYQKDNK